MPKIANTIADKYLILPKILGEIKLFETSDALLNKTHQDIDPENIPMIIIDIALREKLLAMPIENTPTKLMIVIGFVNVNRNVAKINEIMACSSILEFSCFIIDLDLSSFTARYISIKPPNILMSVDSSTKNLEIRVIPPPTSKPYTLSAKAAPKPIARPYLRPEFRE